MREVLRFESKAEWFSMNFALHYVLVILVILSPLTFLITGQEWLFSPAIWLDSHITYGFTYHYLTSFSDEYYKASRIPFLIPKFYLHQIFGNVLAVKVTLVGYLVLLGSGYYWLIRLIFNKSVALRVLPLVVFYPHLVGSGAGGDSYQTIANIYFIGSLISWMMDIHSKSHKRTWLITSGFLLASAVICNVVILNLVPLFFFYRIDEFKKPKESILQKLKYILIGVVFCFLFWGIINYLHGRAFIFILPLLKMLFLFLSEPENQKQWWKPLSSLFFLRRGDGLYLAFYLGLFLTACTAFFGNVNRGDKYKITLPFILIITLWIVWQAIGHTALQPFHFIYPLQVPAFILLASWMPKVEFKKSDALPLGLIILVLWLTLYDSSTLHFQFRIRTHEHFVSVLICVVFASTLGILLARKFRFVSYFLFIILGLCYGLFYTEPSARSGECKFREESHKAIFKIADHLISVEPNPYQISIYGKNGEFSPFEGKCYYNNGVGHRYEDYYHVFRGISGVPLARNHYPIDLPFELKDEDLRRVAYTKKLLVVFSGEDNSFLLNLDTIFKIRGYVLEAISDHSVDVEGKTVRYHLLRLKKKYEPQRIRTKF